MVGGRAKEMEEVREGRRDGWKEGETYGGKVRGMKDG